MGAELIFIPSPGVGHLVSTVEMAMLLTRRDQRLSITVLVMKTPFDTGVTAYTRSLQKDGPNGVVVVELPQPDPPVSKSMSPLLDFIQSQTTQVRDYVRLNCNGSNTLAAFVIDMFCTSMIDVANEFSVPTYMFFTSGAAFLGLQFYHLKQIDEHNRDLFEYKDSDELSIPAYINPVPVKVLPSVMMTNESSKMVQTFSRRFKEAKAILVNTFMELEPHAIKSLADDCTIPPVYPVGPIINLDKKEGTSENKDSEDGIISWLDNQPPCSVVFLCFGSFGSFEEGQVREIANGLEQSGHRFLWSLRRSSPQQAGRMELPKDYEDPSEVLPEGFMERTSGIGKVIGWAPQVAILSHIAVGGFVSHCGWNSTLESIWFGVPMATWPLYAEQQMNAFELVKELGIAVEIKMDYRKKDAFSDAKKPVVVVTADEIEQGIRRLMDGESEIRKKMKDMKEMSRMAVAESGSSYVSLMHFIEEVVGNVKESV